MYTKYRLHLACIPFYFYKKGIGALYNLMRPILHFSLLTSNCLYSFPFKSWSVIAHTQESDHTFSAVSIMSMMV